VVTNEGNSSAAVFNFTIPQGATGATGPQGVQGIQGTTGATGPQGVAGTNGKSVLNGSVNPAAAVGVDGDFYINTTTNVIFGPKANNAWPANGTALAGQQIGFNVPFTSQTGLSSNGVVYTATLGTPDFNDGGGTFTSSTSYTAPKDGVYALTAHLSLANAGTSMKMEIEETKNGVTRIVSSTTQPSSATGIEVNIIVKTISGAQYRVKLTGSGSTSNKFDILAGSYFAGYFVY
jgi:hypothetical protein